MLTPNKLRGAEFNLTNDMTREKFADFVGSAQAKNAKIKGYVNERNETVLYISQPKAKTIRNFISKAFYNLTSQSKDRTDRARTGLADVIKVFASNSLHGKKVNEESGEAIHALVSHFIDVRLSQTADSPKVGTAGQELLKLDEIFSQATDTASRLEPVPQPNDLTLAKLGISPDSEWSQSVKGQLGTLGDDGKWASLQRDLTLYQSEENGALQKITQLNTTARMIRSEINDINTAKGTQVDIVLSKGDTEKIRSLEQKLANVTDQVKLNQDFKESLADKVNQLKIQIAETETQEPEAGVMALAQTLGRALANKLTEDELYQAKFSGNQTLVAEIQGILEKNAGESPMLKAIAGSVARRIVDQALCKLFDNKPTDTPAVPLTYAGKTLKFYELSFGDKTYTPERILGQGAFGSAVLYKAGNGEQMVVKVPPVMEGENYTLALQDVKAESENYQILQNSGNDKAIGYKGTVRLPDGNVGIGLELAPYGDAQGLAKILKAQISSDPSSMKSGEITNDEANLVRLALMRDMCKGLAKLHDTTGMLHLDFKAANIFIDSDGKGRVADFGTGLSGSKASWEKVSQFRIDAPYYKSPEMLFHGMKPDLQPNYKPREGFEPKVKALDDKIKNDLSGLFEGNPRGLENLIDGMHSQLRQDSEITQKSDIWSLGAAAIELFTGAPMTANIRGDVESFVYLSEDHITNAVGKDDFVAMGVPTKEGKVQPNSLAIGTGDESIDGLINDILKPNPNDRPTAKSLLERSPLDDDSLDSPQIRNLIKALASGDKTAIDQARVELSRVRMEMIDL